MSAHTKQARDTVGHHVSDAHTSLDAEASASEGSTAGVSTAGVSQELMTLVKAVCAAHSVDLLELKMTGDGRSRVLRAFIERSDTPVQREPEPRYRSGVTIDDCTSVSRDLSAAFDVQEDLVRGAFRLEVSSPGVERQLYELGDYERFVDFPVKMRFADENGSRQSTEAHIVGVDRESTAVLIKPHERTSRRNAGPEAIDSLKIDHARIEKAHLLFV